MEGSINDNILYKQHLLVAHQYWKEFLEPADTVIDATCGNGHDTQILASLVPKGKVYSMDIQEAALNQARQRVKAPHIHFIHGCHSKLPCPAKLVVYNLGYLPGGDKSITTLTSSTLESLKQALELAQAISITCYPGHSEGAKETQEVYEFVKNLDPKCWKITHHAWKPTAPSLFWVTES